MDHSTLDLRVIKKKKPPLTRWRMREGARYLDEGLGLRVWGLGLRVEGLGFRVSGLGFRV